MLNQIDRLVRLGSYDRLIERLLPLAACRSAQAAESLKRPESAPAAAIGLAMRRCCELAYYRPTPLARRLAGQLMRLQRADGLFGDGHSPLVGASAIALRALIEWRTLCGAVDAPVDRLEERITRGFNALRGCQHGDGLLDHDPIGSAIALSALGDHPLFRASVDLARLVAAIDRCEAITPDLNRYAHAKAA